MDNNFCIEIGLWFEANFDLSCGGAFITSIALLKNQKNEAVWAHVHSKISNNIKLVQNALYLIIFSLKFDKFKQS